MYDKLRQEFQGESFRLNMKSELGNKCVNCGSTENIEYHHIVPLRNGGTNNLSKKSIVLTITLVGLMHFIMPQLGLMLGNQVYNFINIIDKII